MEINLHNEIARTLKKSIRSVRPISGGDINDAYLVELTNSDHVFVKTNSDAPANMFEAEADGLRWLKQSNTLRIPDVIAVSPSNSESPFIVLECIDSRPKRADYDERLGMALAEMHQSYNGSFGYARANYIGRLHQDNTPTDTWADFYIMRRLEPQVKLAVDQHRSTSFMRSGFSKLFSKMEDRLGPTEPAARLHGDLWSGNAIADESGGPCLIDPAVYGGHREMDLAMMRLFGGFSETCFDAYHAAYPLSEGYRKRVELHQLYPLMVHVNLFGGSYVDHVERTLKKYI